MKKQDTFEDKGGIAFYSRVSTRKQDNEAQNLALREYQKNRGWESVQWFQEKISGAKVKRRERDELLKLCRQHKIKTVVVWKLSRWGRSVPDVLSTLKELDQLGVNFISITEAIDMSTPLGRAMVGMIAVFDEFNREIILEQMWQGRLRYKEENGNLGGRRPRAMEKAPQVIALKKQNNWGASKIAEQLEISPSSVRRILKSHSEGES